MFENLGERLQNAMNKIKGYGKITEENISAVNREIRLALLEADVNYKVVKEFTNKVKEKALGEEVAKSLKPGEQFVKIVKDELVELLGGEKAPLNLKGSPAVLMLVGLQGSGKTTTIGKLGLLLRKKYHLKPLLVACDVYRPAAIDQLKQIGRELNIEVYSEGKKDPIEISKNAIKYARENGYNYVLIDTAGRLHVDDALMQELQTINETVKQYDVVLVQLKPEHFDYFDKHNIKYSIAYPNINNWEEVEKRCIARGNNENFIKRLKEVFIPYYEDSIKRNYDKLYILNDKETLEDVLKKENII